MHHIGAGRGEGFKGHRNFCGYELHTLFAGGGTNRHRINHCDQGKNGNKEGGRSWKEPG